MSEQFVDARDFAEALTHAALEGKRNERELREVIRQAVSLIGVFHQLLIGRELPDHDGRLEWCIKAWLALPAVQSAIALEAADNGA